MCVSPPSWMDSRLLNCISNLVVLLTELIYLFWKYLFQVFFQILLYSILIYIVELCILDYTCFYLFPWLRNRNWFEFFPSVFLLDLMTLHLLLTPSTNCGHIFSPSYMASVVCMYDPATSVRSLMSLLICNLCLVHLHATHGSHFDMGINTIAIHYNFIQAS